MQIPVSAKDAMNSIDMIEALLFIYIFLVKESTRKIGVEKSISIDSDTFITVSSGDADVSNPGFHVRWTA